MRLKYTALNDDGVDLLEDLLTYDPRERIVGKDALEHPYFDTLDREAIGKIMGMMASGQLGAAAAPESTPGSLSYGRGPNKPALAMQPSTALVTSRRRRNTQKWGVVRLQTNNAKAIESLHKAFHSMGARSFHDCPAPNVPNYDSAFTPAQLL